MQALNITEHTYQQTRHLPGAERYGLLIIPCPNCSEKQDGCRQCYLSGYRFASMTEHPSIIGEATRPRMHNPYKRKESEQ